MTDQVFQLFIRSGNRARFNAETNPATYPRSVIGKLKLKSHRFIRRLAVSL